MSKKHGGKVGFVCYAWRSAWRLVCPFIVTRPGLGGVEGMLVFANAAGCVLRCLGVSYDDCMGKALGCSEYST